MEREYSKLAPYYHYIGQTRGHFQSQQDFLSGILQNNNYTKSVLDASCGTGDVLNGLSKMFPFIKFYGSDISNPLLNRTFNQPYLYEDNIKLSDWEQLSENFPQNNMDFIYILGNSIAHAISIDKLEKTFSEVNKLLKDDGLFIFDARPWHKNIMEDSFNEPYKEKYINIVNGKIAFSYRTNYFYKDKRHHLQHILNVEEKKEIVVNFSFLDVSKVTLIDILKKNNFYNIKVIEDFDKYPFITLIAKKCS
ncbi:MAG: class I SAM-dependent methyltransferase [Candidatus Scalindua rubra]|uniref:Glycine/sarcosine N-methyltransferase n=1 Tax=Candidatus Scalindua brodae TaxID=237368 RepID=A0A0B0EIM4_9BACT|nr:MAG: Glycine/sarcosine N-methyltransferase [Candidatus Scalindua brodae]MBZ0109120.1 class I SAM-dependent methyltransferase [Candidatus Scalindua rubra]TWU33556.1 Glycine/sarcosine N-methyltransferase [Candidatus Brocadiaceae bacterium S225]